MGTRGPAPKRSTQRRRTNKPATPTRKAPGAAEVTVPKANPKWHAIAKRWFDALGKSGQSKFYEPSDWATAELIAESISRDLKPQVVGVTGEGEAQFAQIPLKGASLAAYLKAMSSLLVTEGDRRRVSLELERPVPPPAGEGDAHVVSELDEYRNRLQSG